MFGPKLVATLTLLIALGAPAAGGAETSRRPRPEEPRGGLAAALFELRGRVAAWWSELADGEPVSAAEEAGEPGETEGDGHGGYDPTGTQAPPSGDVAPPSSPAA